MVVVEILFVVLVVVVVELLCAVCRMADRRGWRTDHLIENVDRYSKTLLKINLLYIYSIIGTSIAI